VVRPLGAGFVLMTLGFALTSATTVLSAFAGISPTTRG
jgi:hypothetical protein